MTTFAVILVIRIDTSSELDIWPLTKTNVYTSPTEGLGPGNIRQTPRFSSRVVSTTIEVRREKQRGGINI